MESSWLGIAKAFVGRVPEAMKAIGKGFLPGSMKGEANRLTGRSREILAAYYGSDIGDHMPFETIEDFLDPEA